MTVRFIFNSRLPKFWGAIATTIYPFVFCAQSAEEALRTNVIAHELVHVDDIRQQGFVRFYLTYLRDFVSIYWKTKNYWHSYYNLPAEQKAYKLEHTKELYARAQEVARTGKA